jgi:hypothetical protein
MLGVFMQRRQCHSKRKSTLENALGYSSSSRKIDSDYNTDGVLR